MIGLTTTPAPARSPTRVAITAFQASEGLSPDGTMSPETAERVARRANGGSSPPLKALPEIPTGRISALHARYVALDAKLDEAVAARGREERLAAKVSEARAFAQAALALPLPSPVRDDVTRHLRELDTAGATPGSGTVLRLAAEFDALKPGVEEAVTLAKATTPKNAFITTGDAGDVLVLYNDTGRAPSVVKNLRGELVFEAGRTTACQPNGGSPDVATGREVNARLSRWNQSLRWPLPRCVPAKLAANDLVVVSRGELLKERAGDVAALLSAVDAGVLVTMVTVTAEEARAAQQAEAVRALEIEGAVEGPGRQGFGVVALANGSSVLCGVVSADREAHEALLKPHLPRIAEEVKGTPTFVATTAEAAFVAGKRGQCGAIHASGTDLAMLVPALRRDALAFRYLPMWLEAQEIEGARLASTDGRTKSMQQEADRRRRQEDEKRLQAEKDGDAAVVRARRTADLQRQHGAVAKAFENVLSSEAKEFVEGRSERAAFKYPALAAWFKERLNDRWELVSVDTTLVDYGTAKFKGRALEAGYARTVVKMRNRVLGEYGEGCFVTGYVADAELNMPREPVDAPCEERGTIAAHRIGQRFASRWIAP